MIARRLDLASNRGLADWLCADATQAHLVHCFKVSGFVFPPPVLDRQAGVIDPPLRIPNVMRIARRTIRVAPSVHVCVPVLAAHIVVRLHGVMDGAQRLQIVRIEHSTTIRNGLHVVHLVRGVTCPSLPAYSTQWFPCQLMLADPLPSLCVVGPLSHEFEIPDATQRKLQMICQSLSLGLPFWGKR